MSATIRALGGSVKAAIAGWITAADLPAREIGVLAREPGVLELSPSEPVYADLDRSVPEIGADRAWTIPDGNGFPIQGRHVLVGIVDSGIDYHNPDFKNPDGSTRIKYIWDQTRSGRPPAGFDFGFECDSASIQSGSCPERDTDGHGTMVAGIAAGNGRSSTPPHESGVAPVADIIVVKRGEGADATNDNIAAWKYLVQKAQQLGEPIVINNSWGSGMTPHDGSSPESLAVDALSGPGHIFVAAAGNEANQNLHVDGSLHQGATTSIQLAADTYQGRAAFAVFFAPDDQLTFTLTDTDIGESFGPVTANDRIEGQLSRDGNTRVTILPGLWDARHSGVYVVLESASGRQIEDHYSFELDTQHVAADDRYDAWMENDHEASFSGADESDTIGDPADARGAIAVGNYITRASWTAVDGQRYLCSKDLCPNEEAGVGDIAISSSAGPTADGRQKPDIAAPGTMIFSSLSHDATVCTGNAAAGCIPQWRVTHDGKNYIGGGTSSAAPHVAGTIALMLQIDPFLTPASIMSVLRATARHDQFTGTASWTPQFGAGKLDAYAAVRAVLGFSSPTTVTPSPSPTAAVPPTPTPTAAPPPGEAAFQLLAVRAQGSTTSNRQPASTAPPRFHAGHPIALAISVRVTALPRPARLAFSWSITARGRAVAHHGQHLDLAAGHTGQYTRVWTHALHAPGPYLLHGSVTLDRLHRSRTVTVHVAP